MIHQKKANNGFLFSSALSRKKSSSRSPLALLRLSGNFRFPTLAGGFDLFVDRGARVEMLSDNFMKIAAVNKLRS